jgi:glucokinase
MRDATSAVTVGIDVGGTKLCAAAVDARGHVIAYERRPAPVGDYEGALTAIAEATSAIRLQAAAQGAAVTAVGVAAAAFFDADRELVRQATNLGWHRRTLRADLAERVGLPVIVENDADAAAWGEYAHGAALGEPCVVMATLGTGIGGGIVIGGRLLSGGYGLAGELGHLQVAPGGLRCGCGARGCLEQYASGTVLARVARDAVTANPHATRLSQASSIDGPLVTRLAVEGDAVARQALAEIGTWLGRGLALVATVVDPSLIVIGGGVATAGDLILDPIRAAYRHAIGIPAVRPLAPIRAAALGNQAGAIGAAAIARAISDRSHVQARSQPDRVAG